MNRNDWVQFIVKAYGTVAIEASATLQNELLSRVQEGNVTRKQKEVFQEAVLAVTTVFYKMATKGNPFGSLKRIKDTFGFTLEQNYALTEGPFIKMARTYWTFKIEVEDLFEKDSDRLIWQILNKVERNIGSLFFPMPGPAYISVRKRAKTQRSQLQFFTPNIDINRLIYENPVLDNESKRSLLSFLWRTFTKTWFRVVSARKANHRKSFVQTPKWYRLIPNSDCRPPKSKVAKLEEVRIRYDVSHEHFAFFVTGSPSTTRNLQYAILKELKVDHPHARDKEVWTMVLKSRSLSRLNRGAPGIPDHEIERIVSNASSFENICNYIVMLDSKEKPPDSIGIENAINKAIEN